MSACCWGKKSQKPILNKMREQFQYGLDPTTYNKQKEKFKELYAKLNKKTKEKKVTIDFPEDMIAPEFDAVFDVDETPQQHSLSDFIHKISEELPESCPLRGGVSVGSACWWMGKLVEIIDKLLVMCGGRKKNRRKKRKTKRRTRKPKKKRRKTKRKRKTRRKKRRKTKRRY